MARPPLPERLQLQGPVGELQAVVEDPGEGATPEALIVICHPHPLHGGTMDNKVVTTLARAAHELSCPSVRFNFRGVGSSGGSHDDGRGEVDDALAVVAWGRRRWPQARLWLAGFSFGGVVALRAAARVGAGNLARLVTVAPALGRGFGSPANVPVPQCPWLVVQGDADDIVDPGLVIDWASRLTPAPQVAVLPGVGHFFHGQLGALQQQVQAFLAGP